jgi:hypothetical protein
MNSEKAVYTGFEFEAEGYPAIAIINRDLVNLENKSAYNHSVFISVVPDRINEFGHPEEAEYDYLNEVEKAIINYLEGQTTSVHVGHITMYRKREIIFYTATPETVEGFLDSYMPTIERECFADIEEDPEWEDVSGFYEQL